LLAAVPDIEPDGVDMERAALIEGEIPSPLDPPSGCRVRTRCPHARPGVCEQPPALAEIEPGHAIACNRWPDVRADEAWARAGV
ncbi:MAG: oligopeptide/dipeptide ABC transporter ATP-binding protein, partial [Actinomycetota bacterium]